MRKLLLLPILLSITMLFSQESQIISTGTSGSDMLGSNQIIAGSSNGVWIRNSSVVNELEGTYYLFENWKNRAIVYDLNNKAYNLPNCNFNIESNSVEAQLDEVKDEIFAFNSRDIQKVEFGDQLFVKKNSNKGSNQLLEVIHQGEKMALYKEYETSILKASVNPMTLKKIGKDKIVKNSIYYIEKTNKLEEIKIKKSTVLNLMGDKKNEIKSYIKENKLSLSEDIDLSKIFQYYNTL